ncbi:MAG: pantoate--beta-alanine ligase [Bacteroidales bacterium]|jgi:pantoate--beta-alanine ligase
MKIIRTINEIKERINRLRLHPVGFVPTMGALHEGHLSLVRNATDECPLAVISIYVNPTQFNDKSDLERYPRTPGADLSLLKGIIREEDIVFIPDDHEMYPSEDKRIFHFGNLENVMEAVRRPGHFNGVAQIVSKLFDIIRPDIAYFGLKDFQQVAVIKNLVRQMNLEVKIEACPIIREADGLAMSSRNRLLEPGIRVNASIIYRTISEAAAMMGHKDVPFIKNHVKNAIENKIGFKVEYFEIVDDIELIPVNSVREINKGKKYFGCIAVTAGKIRLIDNIELPLA